MVMWDSTVSGFHLRVKKDKVLFFIRTGFQSNSNVIPIFTATIWSSICVCRPCVLEYMCTTCMQEPMEDKEGHQVTW